MRIFDHIRIHGEDAPPTLDEKRVHDIVNGALQRMQTQVIPGMLKPFQDQFGQLTENLTKLSETLASRQEEGDKGKGNDKGKASGELPPEVNARLQELERQRKADAAKLEKLENDRRHAEERAANTEKESKIRAALGQFAFTSPEAQEDAFTLVAGMIERNEAGELIGGDNLPYDVFIKDFVPSKKRYLLAESGKGGSGATSGSTRGGAAQVDLNAIRPGMSRDAMMQTAAAIRQALPGGGA